MSIVVVCLYSIFWCSDHDDAHGDHDDANGDHDDADGDQDDADDDHDVDRPGPPIEGRTLAKHPFCQSSLLEGRPPDQNQSDNLHIW